MPDVITDTSVITKLTDYVVLTIRLSTRSGILVTVSVYMKLVFNSIHLVGLSVNLRMLSRTFILAYRKTILNYNVHNSFCMFI